MHGRKLLEIINYVNTIPTTPTMKRTVMNKKKTQKNVK